ncbi:hypothetical protein Bbelb_376080 [Branchiostoma belcheri]|nr:hypothetical protein Bbelb_376080 [Branchiostoma belcheri]
MKSPRRRYRTGRCQITPLHGFDSFRENIGWVAGLIATPDGRTANPRRNCTAGRVSKHILLRGLGLRLSPSLIAAIDPSMFGAITALLPRNYCVTAALPPRYDSVTTVFVPLTDCPRPSLIPSLIAAAIDSLRIDVCRRRQTSRFLSAVSDEEGRSGVFGKLIERVGCNQRRNHGGVSAAQRAPAGSSAALSRTGNQYKPRASTSRQTSGGGGGYYRGPCPSLTLTHRSRETRFCISGYDSSAAVSASRRNDLRKCVFSRKCRRDDCPDASGSLTNCRVLRRDAAKADTPIAWLPVSSGRTACPSLTLTHRTRETRFCISGYDSSAAVSASRRNDLQIQRTAWVRGYRQTTPRLPETCQPVNHPAAAAWVRGYRQTTPGLPETCQPVNHPAAAAWVRGYRQTTPRLPETCQPVSHPAAACLGARLPSDDAKAAGDLSARKSPRRCCLGARLPSDDARAAGDLSARKSPRRCCPPGCEATVRRRQGCRRLVSPYITPPPLPACLPRGHTRRPHAWRRAKLPRDYRRQQQVSSGEHVTLKLIEANPEPVATPVRGYGGRAMLWDRRCRRPCRPRPSCPPGRPVNLKARQQTSTLPAVQKFRRCFVFFSRSPRKFTLARRRLSRPLDKAVAHVRIGSSDVRIPRDASPDNPGFLPSWRSHPSATCQDDTSSSRPKTLGSPKTTRLTEAMSLSSSRSDPEHGKLCFSLYQLQEEEILNKQTNKCSFGREYVRLRMTPRVVVPVLSPADQVRQGGHLSRAVPLIPTPEEITCDLGVLVSAAFCGQKGGPCLDVGDPCPPNVQKTIYIVLDGGREGDAGPAAGNDWVRRHATANAGRLCGCPEGGVCRLAGRRLMTGPGGTQRGFAAGDDRVRRLVACWPRQSLILPSGAQLTPTCIITTNNIASNRLREAAGRVLGKLGAACPDLSSPVRSGRRAVACWVNWERRALISAAPSVFHTSERSSTHAACIITTNNIASNRLREAAGRVSGSGRRAVACWVNWERRALISAAPSVFHTSERSSTHAACIITTNNIASNRLREAAGRVLGKLGAACPDLSSPVRLSHFRAELNSRRPAS